MKKYFIHNGIEHQVPFDLYDIKAKLIKKDTPIWYEGISDWTIAEIRNKFRHKSKIKTLTITTYTKSL